VTDFRSSDLSMLDLRSGATRRIAFPSDNCFEPHGIDISQDGRTLYVACAGDAWIDTVDARTLRPGRVLVTAPGAIGVAVNAPRHEVWVTNQTANSVSVVDEKTPRVLATIGVGKGPALLVPTPDGHTVYVANLFGSTVSVIDAARRRIVATIAVAARPITHDRSLMPALRGTTHNGPVATTDGHKAGNPFTFTVR
jgi:YVTN family beta-propeller protein